MSEPTWIPEPNDTSRPFFEGAKEGKLRLQCCTDCNTWSYPSMTVCINCGSNNIEWKDATGNGTVYSHGRLARPYHARHKDRLPLILAQVDIDEGVRLNTNIIDIDPSEVKVGDRVTLTFEQFEDGGVLPVFKPVS